MGKNLFSHIWIVVQWSSVIPNTVKKKNSERQLKNSERWTLKSICFVSEAGLYRRLLSGLLLRLRPPVLLKKKTNKQTNMSQQSNVIECNNKSWTLTCACSWGALWRIPSQRWWADPSYPDHSALPSLLGPLCRSHIPPVHIPKTVN